MMHDQVLMVGLNTLPGYPFNGNVFLDISDFAEKNVIFRVQSRFDDNDDGGSGTGLMD